MMSLSKLVVLQQEGQEGLLAEYGPIVTGVIKFVVGFVVVYALGRLVLVPLVDRVLDRRGFDPTVKSLADNVTNVLVLVLAIAVAFTVAGFGSVIAAFSVLAGVVALAVGFAMQNLLANFASGVFILKDKPFEVGDWIEWSGGEGRVQDIDLRVTRVKTFDNELVTVPNSNLADNEVKNPVAYDRLRNKFVFGIGYDDDIDHAKEIILDEASKVEDIMDDPGTSIRVNELADSYVGLQTRYWIADPNRADHVAVTSELVQNVKERCDAEGIDMPYPYRQLTGEVGVEGHLETDTPETRADD